MIGDGRGKRHDWDVTHSYDNRSEPPSEVVARAVASTTNRGVCSIEPLYETVEPDALDAFINGSGATSRPWITFSYEGCRVYVDRDEVSVTRLDDDAVQ